MMSSNVFEVKEKDYNFVLFAFIFTMMFSFVIAGVAMRYFVILFWFFYSLARIKKVYMHSALIIFPTVLYIIIMHSLVLVSIYNTENMFEFLRSARAISTYVVIFLFLSSGEYSLKQVMNTLMLVLLVHALSIIVGIVFPTFKEVIQPISQYSIEFMKARSSGLLSGYDDAGYLCNIGLLLVLVKNTIQKKKLVDIYAFVFMIAAILTSRVNIVLMVIVLVIIFILNIRKMNIKGLLNISKYLVGIGIFAIIILALTTNIGFGLRTTLLQNYPRLISIVNLMEGSYTDYGVYSGVISRHLNISDLSLNQIFFGAGFRKTTSDVGYVKTIYSIGVIGILLQMIVYVRAIINVHRMRIKNKYNSTFQISSLTFIIAVILMFTMELKISFIFSSTTFEMLSVLYIAVILAGKNVVKV